MDSVVLMEQLSKEYGWTPSQIRKEKASDIFAYWDIIPQRLKIEKEMAEKEGEKIRKEANRHKK